MVNFTIDTTLTHLKSIWILSLTSPVLSFLVGAIAGPATGLFNFAAWAGGSSALESVTTEFTRLSLCVQVLLTAIQLPGKFVKDAWRSLVAMLLPGMTLMWLMSSLLIWAIIAIPGDDGGSKRMPFLYAMAIGACIAPTDPVLASTIIKGRWAEQHVPGPLVRMMSGESGANDGLGFPFVFLSLYLIAYVGGSGEYVHTEGGAGRAMAHFFGNTIAYMVILGTVWGAIVGYVGAKLIKVCQKMQYVEQESFFAFPILLAIFLIGTCGMAGSNDILAAFAAGNALSWDDWFRRNTAKDSFSTTIEMFLNIALFIYLGAICPWRSFAPVLNEETTPFTIPLWRLVCLAIAILALRRIPPVLLLYKLRLLRPHVQTLRQAGFVGFFGPMGISTIFYLYQIRDFCMHSLGDGKGGMRPDAEILYNISDVIIWFLVASSVVSSPTNCVSSSHKLTWTMRFTA